MDKKRIWKKILTGVVIASMYAGIVGVHLYRNNLDRDMVIVEESWEDEDVPLAEQPGGIDSICTC